MWLPAHRAGRVAGAGGDHGHHRVHVHHPERVLPHGGRGRPEVGATQVDPLLRERHLRPLPSRPLRVRPGPLRVTGESGAYLTN